MASDVKIRIPPKAGRVQRTIFFVEVDGTKFEERPSLHRMMWRLDCERPESTAKVQVVMERNVKNGPILTRKPIKSTAVKSYLATINGVGKVG
jgi:hypothetical protein